MYEDYIKVFEYLSENFPKHFNDVYTSLELLSDTLVECSNHLGECIKTSVDCKDFDRINQLSNISQTVNNLNETINEYIERFTSYEMISDSPSSNQEQDEDDENNIPNYSEFTVDTNIIHHLSGESFTHKKICGFELNGVRYNVSNWKDALITICSILSKTNASIMNTFPDLDKFKGSKISYFSRKNDNDYYRKIRNSDIYVWTNMSANAICTVIKKVLRSYKIPVNSVSIFLRADYTPLHLDNNRSHKVPVADETTVKIGKYVRSTMRDLSNKSFCFSSDMLNKLTNASETQKIFGMGIPILKEYNSNIDITVQIKDEKGNSRYWKEIFNFNGKKYLVTSQWYSYHQARFDKWLKEILK